MTESLTINNTEAREIYELALNSPTFANTRLNLWAKVADAAVEAMSEEFRLAGVKFPNDDRIENIVTEVFHLLVEENV